MTTPVPDFADLVSIVSRLHDPVSIRVTRSILESQVQVFEAQVNQLREVTKTLAEVEQRAAK
jgi:hypothetical protein